MIVTLGYIKDIPANFPNCVHHLLWQRLMAEPPSILFIFNSLAKFSQLAFFLFQNG
jgi:hypothetical protein